MSMFGFLTDDNDNDDDDDGDEEDGDKSDLERQEMEIALYSQIHFEPASDNVTSDTYSFDVYHQCLQDEKEDKSGVSNCGSNSIKDNNENKEKVAESDKGYLKEQTKGRNDQETISSEEKNQSSDEFDGDQYVVIDSAGSDELEFDSDLMILDETLSDVEEDIKVHVNKSQQDILMGLSDLQDIGNKVDEKKWAILDKDRYSDTEKKKRYYKPISVRCNNCRDVGHLSKDCPKPQKNKICFLCGFTGHNNKTCPNGLCYNCEGVGHISYDCPSPWKSRRMECHRCAMLGHSQYECPDLWRQFHLTTIPGTLRESEHKENKKVWCYNCASSKHFGYDCPKDRMDKHSQPSYPFVAVYRLSKKHERLKRKRGYSEDEEDRIHITKKAKYEHNTNRDRDSKNNDDNKNKKLLSFAARVKEKMDFKTSRKPDIKKSPGSQTSYTKQQKCSKKEIKDFDLKDNRKIIDRTDKRKIEFGNRQTDRRISITLTNESDEQLQKGRMKKKQKYNRKKNVKGPVGIQNFTKSQSFSPNDRQVQKTSRGFKISFNTQMAHFKYKH